MTLTWFPNGCALNSKDVMSKFLVSANSRLGLDIQENNMDADIAVIWSVLWNGRMASNQEVYNHFINSGKPVIVLDVGALKRNITWKIAVNHINAQGHYGHEDNLDLDRPQKLGVALQTQQTNNGKILIAGQHKKSLQLKDVDQEEWINNQIRTIQQSSDRPIVVRPHPRSVLNGNRLVRTGVEFERPTKVAKSYDDFNIDYNYYTVINYNSGPGIQAAINGAQIVVDKTSLAYPVSNTINNIENLTTFDRNDWFIKICHTEYTVDEIAKGVWCDRLAPALNL